MAAKSSNNKTAKKPAAKGRSFKLTALKNQKAWFTLSLLLNAILIVGLLFSISNPTTFTDASSGYSIDIPAGWARQDKFDVFRLTEGASERPKAEIFAYGQRNATLGFYDSPEEDRNTTLDLVTEQINGGQNQFILPSIGLSDYDFDAERGQRDDGTEYILSGFTAIDAEGQPVQGRHMLLITRGGGIYTVMGYADADHWTKVESEVEEVISTFTAP